MNRKDILDYVRKTPTNTNVNVLGSMIDSVVRDSGESCGGVTYETIFEDDVEMRGVAPGMVAYEFTGTAELYNNIITDSEYYKLSIGDNSCYTSMWKNSSNMKYVINTRNDLLRFTINDGESNTPYAASFSTTGDTGTYHVSLKRVIIPEE